MSNLFRSRSLAAWGIVKVIDIDSQSSNNLEVTGKMRGKDVLILFGNADFSAF